MTPLLGESALMHGRQEIRPSLLDFGAARSSSIEPAQLRMIVAALQTRYSRTRTPERPSPYCWVYLWLARIPQLRGVAWHPMTKGVPIRTCELGFNHNTFNDFIERAKCEYGSVEVQGAPPIGVDSCYSRILPNWSLGIAGVHLKGQPRRYGLKIHLRNLVPETWFDLYRKLFEFWEIENEVQLHHVEGGFRITVPDPEKDWVLRTPHKVAGTPAWTELYHWLEAETPARMLTEAVDRFFSSASYQTLGLGLTVKDLESARSSQNAFTTSWISIVDPGYKKDFDPYVRPDWATDDDPVRCPVLFWYDRTPEQDVVPVLQVDVIHTSRGSFLELQSVRGHKKMNEFIKVAGVPFEFWEGPPHLRWDGKGTAVGVG